MNIFDRNIGKDALDGVPSAPGVYQFWKGDELLYIGRAKNLKRRLSQYRLTTRRKKHRRMRKVVNSSERVTFEVCETHLDACLLEIRLIQSMKPSLNIVGTYSAIYPYIGVVEKVGILQFSFGAAPSIFGDHHSYGAFRSREVCGLAYFALMRLFSYIGHQEPRSKNISLPRGTHLHAFRRLPGDWIELWREFFDGKSRVALTALSEALLEKVDARAASSKIEDDLSALNVFWHEEARPLRQAIDVTNYQGNYPVPQEERDPLFLLWRSAECS